MATKHSIPLLSLSSALWILSAIECAAAVPGHGVRVVVEVVANRVDGSASSRCTTSAEVEPNTQAEWWVAATEGTQQPAGQDKLGGRIECGAGQFAPTPGAAASGAALHVGISTTPRVIPEQDPYLEILVNVRKRSGRDSRGEPLYDESKQKRRLFFSDSADVVIPLLVSSAGEREALGLHEAFVRVEARAATPAGRAAYGTLWVMSDIKGAKVLLDGGTAGSIADSGEVILRNVLAGEHDVSVHDSAGPPVRRIVRVPEKRTVLVELNRPSPTSGAVPYGLAALGKNASGYEEYRRQRDGATVVRIPAGEFLMGNARTERQPLEHRVYVSEFLMDKTDVTWAQYKRFAGATLTPLPPDEPYWGILDDHPAVFVTWEEAKAYCEWVGGRLPTEAEWEKAARGTDDRKFPWGNEEPTPDRAVYRHAWGYPATDAVTAHPSGASPYGLLDMGGNVWQWCADWYDDKYYEVSPARDPKGPTSGQARVVRGGSWDSRPDVLSCSCRNWGYRGYREGDFGFRCAMDLPGGAP